MTIITSLTVSSQEWGTARERLFVQEKALTRARDSQAAERRRMPWYATTDGFHPDFGVGQP